MYYPNEISDVLYNPYMGWVPWAQWGPYAQQHTMVMALATWREIEPTQGNFAWSTFESFRNFSQWKAAGKKIVIRIIMDQPGASDHLDIPDWLYSAIGQAGTHYSIPWGVGFSPDYSNSTLIARHADMVAALAARYNNDPDVAMIQLGSLGHWGEWHTYNESQGTGPVGFPGVAITDQYAQHYATYFTNKFSMMRRPHAIARDNGMGLFNDSFGDHQNTYSWFINYFLYGYTFWITGEQHPAMPTFWHTAPSGGEILSSPGTPYLQNNTIGETVQQAIDSHLSCLGPACPATIEYGGSIQHNIDALAKAMGYRFVLNSVDHASSVQQSANLSVTMNWENKGCAPFYFEWPLELSLISIGGDIIASEVIDMNDVDIRSWLPGTHQEVVNFFIPGEVSTGTYYLAVAIIDPQTDDPGVQLAISGARLDFRYVLDTVQVTESEEPPPPPPPPPIEPGIALVKGWSLRNRLLIMATEEIVWADQTEIMLRMNGPNLSEVFTDECGSVWTPGGGAYISTAQYVFGGASAYLDGNAFISTPADSKFNVGSNDFTLEFYFKRDAVAATERICGQCNEWNNVNTRAWWVQLTATGYVLFSVAQGESVYQAGSSIAYTDGEWHRFVGVREGNTLRLFVDNVQRGTADVTGVVVNSSIYNLSIGRQGERATDYYKGYIDHFKFDNGVAILPA